MGTVSEIGKNPGASVCATKGCGRRTWGGTLCADCAEQWTYLEKWDRRRQAQSIDRALREHDRAEKLERAGRWVRRAIWIPELIFVAAVLAVLGWDWMAALLRWVATR